MILNLLLVHIFSRVKKLIKKFSQIHLEYEYKSAILESNFVVIIKPFKLCVILL